MEGIVSFLDNNGIIRLICNPELTEEDIKLIELGYSLDASRITKELIRAIDSESTLSQHELDCLDIICNMIAEHHLDIKIAYLPSGIFHEKFGIFTDAIGDQVYFNGSANETVNAKVRNVESITVHKSWTGNEEIIKEEEAYFDALWGDRISEVAVMSFPDAVKQHLFSKYKHSETLEKAIINYKNEGISSDKRSLYDYQSRAIEGFLLNGHRHFYEMATGTGKTFTAIKTIERLRNEICRTLFVVVCVPQIDLQSQWRDELEEEGHKKVFLLGGLNDGKTSDQEYDRASIMYSRKKEPVIVCVAVYETFFAKYATKVSTIKDLFLIVDEAHNLSPQQIKKLPQEIKYRLGLSATIERFNAQETKSILSYFLPEGKSSFYFGIEEAIGRGYLSHYEYYPIFVRLNEEEFEKYQRKTKAIATLLSEKDPDMDEVNKRRMERSLIVKQAQNKLETLTDMMSGYNFKNSVVYCGAGKNDESSIIDEVSQVLHKVGHYTVSQFTSKTADRVAVLDEFEKGFFDTLVAIRCFDEGVDCPKLDKIYIMSSESSLRQTVQRRGRVLRKCRETGKTLAYIFDMIVLPPFGEEYGSGITALIVNELTRGKEYARLAENKDSATDLFTGIEQKYNITESDYEREEQSN